MSAILAMSCASQLSSAFKSGTANFRVNRIASRKVAPVRAIQASAEMKTVSDPRERLALTRAPAGDRQKKCRVQR